MDGLLIAVEGVIITALAAMIGLALLLRLLSRSRPELSIGTPLAVGYVLRLVVIAGISLTGLGATLRGGDELTFLTEARQIAPLSWTSDQWLPTTHQSYLHVLIFAAQIKLLGSSEGALRITQVGISLAGAMLIATAVYDIAGPGPARLTAWLLSLEVASLFFNELLHKEALMELASGLVVFGGASVWARLAYRGMAIMGVGGLIALATRQYVGWFLIACAVVITVHAALRQVRERPRALPIVYAAVAILFLATPAVLQASSPRSLQTNLQAAQNADAGPAAGDSGANTNNLALEKVDFSTRAAIITNLPRRIRDVLLRPYPWQVGDVNQMLGVLGSIVALTCFVALIRYAVLCGWSGLMRAVPLLYPFGFLLVAYALSVGNAGTGFRYRTQLVTLALGAMVVLRAATHERRATVAVAQRGESTLSLAPT
ncbi:MAG: hypothetical protein ABSH51_03450 [Solirubrobacteraceae bacterium]|jgi:hypothetical protein